MNSPINKRDPYSCWITTEDNPFNPFTHFMEWYNFDMIKGYNTCGKLARITGYLPDAFTEDLKNERLNDAIEEMCEYNWIGLYKKVFPEDYD